MLKKRGKLLMNLFLLKTPKIK